MLCVAVLHFAVLSSQHLWLQRRSIVHLRHVVLCCALLMQAFGIYGSSGTNKSTICAMLCGALGKEGATDLHPHAWHFVQQHDRNRWLLSRVGMK